MPDKIFLSLILRKKSMIGLFVIIFLILAAIFSLLQPFKYGSSSQVLVIQNFTNPDPYLASKSTEYLSNILAKVINSNSFFDNVLNSGFFIDKNYFGQTVKEQMKKWTKTVSAKAINDSGIISLNIYHTDKAQAGLIARAVVYTLQTKHGLYHGGGSNVAVKIIDEPITSNYPVKPNLILNFVAAFILGLVFSLAFIYLSAEKKYDLGLSAKFSLSRDENIEKQIASSYRAGSSQVGEAKVFTPQVSAFKSELRPKIKDEIEAEQKFNFSENLDRENNNFDDLDIRDEIIKQGSMKNIFGRPPADDL